MFVLDSARLAHTRAWLRLLREDPHTAEMLLILRVGLAGYRPISAEQIPAPTLPPDPTLPTVPLADPGTGPSLLTTDEDGGARPLWLQALVRALGALSPVRDEALAWEDEPARTLGTLLDPWLPKPRFRIEAPDGAEAMARFVLQGLGAHRLERAGDGVKLDLSSLATLPVRPGFLPYGGVATLNAEGRLLHIAHGGRRVAPDDADFPAFAYHFRTSTLVGVTALDHLGLTHCGVSNALLLATRRHLPAAHPLRRWLKPFLYRTGAINANALASLLADGAMLHRSSALTGEGLTALRRRMLEGLRVESFPDQLRRAGVHPEQLPPGLRGRLCWSEDGVEFWDRLAAFVDRSLDAPVLREALADAHSAAWWQELACQLPGGLPPRSEAAWRLLLGWALFQVTALHSHVGHVAPYVRFPEVAGARARPGDRDTDRRVAQQLNTLAALTGMAVPTLAQDFGHLMPDAETRAAAAQFRRDLADLQALIDARNAQRALPFPAFSPRDMPCSVSR